MDSYTVTLHQGKKIIHIYGSWTYGRVHDIEKGLLDELSENVAIELNISKIDKIDHAGISTLVKWKLSNQHRPFRVISGSDDLLGLMSLTGFDKILEN